jgi:hypothetical protein
VAPCAASSGGRPPKEDGLIWGSSRRPAFPPKSSGDPQWPSVGRSPAKKLTKDKGRSITLESVSYRQQEGDQISFPRAFVTTGDSAMLESPTTNQTKKRSG